MDREDSRRERSDTLILRVWVVAGSSRPRVEQRKDGTYRVYVSSAPEKGKANEELVERMAEHLGIRKGDIQIVRGAGSREKLLRVGRVK